MIYCSNKTCVYCKVDHLGDFLCTGFPNLMETCDSLFNHNIVCSSYVARNESQNMEEVHPGRGKDGLFPGQLKEAT